MWEFIKYCFLCMARILGSGSVPNLTWKEAGIGYATFCVLLGMIVGIFAIFVFFVTRKK